VAGNQPGRHGTRWPQQPSRVGPQERAWWKEGQEQPGGQSVGPAKSGTLSVDQVDAFLNTLPSESIQHVVIADEQPYRAVGAGGVLTLASVAVPENFVWIFTDVQYSAFTPNPAFGATPLQLPPAAVDGLMRFALKFGGRDPLTTKVGALNPYAGYTAQLAAINIEQSGWPWLQKQFGTQRGLSFAIYAKSATEITVEANVDVVPRFPIMKIGVEMHGFSLPESLFNEIWRKG